MKILGIDQSYTNFGLAIIDTELIVDGKPAIILARSFDFKHKGKKLKSKTAKREFVRQLILHIKKTINVDIVIIERIRLHSQGFLSMDYIKSTAALIATIVDNIYPIPVYSIDTRNWKKITIGKTNTEKKQDKNISTRFVQKEYNITVDHDTADAICIAIAYFKILTNPKVKNLTKSEH